VLLHKRKQQLFLFEVMALIGEVAQEVKRFLPRLQCGHRSFRKLFYCAEHALDNAVLIAKNLCWLVHVIGWAKILRICVFHLIISFSGVRRSIYACQIRLPAGLHVRLCRWPPRAKQQAGKHRMDRCALDFR
jgi:hypothetical protein